MKQIVLFVLMMLSFGSQAQNSYRFSVGGGFHSLLFWGFRSFEDVEVPQQYDVNRIYNYEKYDVNYKNFSHSIHYSFGLAINWFNKENWIVSQHLSFYKGQMTDELNLKLTGIGDGSTTDYYPITEFNSGNVGVGSESNVQYKSELQGVLTSMVFLSRLKKMNVFFGAGIYYTMFSSRDRWWNGKTAFLTEGYRTSYMDRGSGVYTSSHIGISLNAVWNWKFIQFYANVGNSIFTTKKAENRGKWYGDFTFFPTSHNFDYRFPLSIETGIAWSFDRIKKGR